MNGSIWFITGTDTGVGKTVFAARLTRQKRKEGVEVAALKPVCSGGRDDARQLREAAGNILTLDEVNPWHFDASLAPLLAARQENRVVGMKEVLAHVRRIALRFQLVIVEGAGGLLSPLGESFDSRDLIVGLQATPFIVCPNRLGAVNQVRLVLEALPRDSAESARVVLVNSGRADEASRTNRALLKEYVRAGRIQILPRLGGA